MLSEYYNTQFYSGQIDGSVRSAKVILPLLYKLYQPLSVIDIGCGLGDWLATAESLGSLKLRGLDGNWVKKEQLLSKNIDFTAVDFQKSVEIEEKYDYVFRLRLQSICRQPTHRFLLTHCANVPMWCRLVLQSKNKVGRITSTNDGSPIG
jgi:SAM-dependent methyltransferase